jgi:hypothetical protein
LYEATFYRALPYDLPKGHVPLETPRRVIKVAGGLDAKKQRPEKGTLQDITNKQN